MTSFMRVKAETKQGLTLFVKPDTPCYNESAFGGDIIPFPFSYNSGVLDINYTGNNFKAANVDVNGVEPDSESDVTVRITSGPYLVTSLGNNFKDYIRAWRASSIDSGSAIDIHIAPQVMKIQIGDPSSVTAGSGNSYLISTSAPNGENYVIGNNSNSYWTSYIFKTPLTFTIMEGGVKQYITFTSHIDQE